MFIMNFSIPSSSVTSPLPLLFPSSSPRFTLLLPSSYPPLPPSHARTYRDASYIAVLTSVLTDAMTSPVFCIETLYENSIALVALEEVIGEEGRGQC